MGEVRSALRDAPARDLGGERGDSTIASLKEAEQHPDPKFQISLFTADRASTLSH